MASISSATVSIDHVFHSECLRSEEVPFRNASVRQHVDCSTCEMLCPQFLIQISRIPAGLHVGRYRSTMAGRSRLSTTVKLRLPESALARICADIRCGFHGQSMIPYTIYSILADPKFKFNIWEIWPKSVNHDQYSANAIEYSEKNAIWVTFRVELKNRFLC